MSSEVSKRTAEMIGEDYELSPLCIARIAEELDKAYREGMEAAEAYCVLEIARRATAADRAPGGLQEAH